MSGIHSWWTWLFGKQLTPQQIVRRNQSLITKAVRNVEREIYKLGREEQKQILEIKRMAQKNQPDVVRTMANDLVRLRGQIKKLLIMKQSLQGVSLHLQTLQTQQSITQAVYQATIVLRGMNTRFNMPQMRAILKEFEKQSQILEIKGELIGETMDDVTGHEDDGEESDDIVNQVLDELGLQIGQQLPEAPQENKNDSRNTHKQPAQVGIVGAGKSVPGTSVSADDELAERLQRLRKS